MLRVIIEVEISDEREHQITQHEGMNYQNLIRYIQRRVADSFKDEKFGVSLRQVKIGPIFDAKTDQVLYDPDKS